MTRYIWGLDLFFIAGGCATVPEREVVSSAEWGVELQTKAVDLARYVNPRVVESFERTLERYQSQ